MAQRQYPHETAQFMGRVRAYHLNAPGPAGERQNIESEPLKRTGVGIAVGSTSDLPRFGQVDDRYVAHEQNEGASSTRTWRSG